MSALFDNNWLRNHLAKLEANKLRETPTAEGGTVEDEDELHNDIIRECRNRGWLYFHGSMAHKTRRTVGEPDFTIIADGGRVFFIECKAKHRKRSTAQIGVALAAGILCTTVHLVESFPQFLSIVSTTPTTTPQASD